MLTKIVVDTEEPFTIPIAGARSKDSILVRKITGLNPPSISVFVGDYARDGGSYQGRRVGERNVVMTFELNPNPALGESVSSLREMLYKTFGDPFADADHVKINLHDSDGRVRYLFGYTEEIEAEPFEQERLVQISILCTDPYIRDIAATRLINPSGWTTVPFEYRGTAAVGFEAEIMINGPTNVLTLENNGRKMVINRAFNEGDMVYVNTRPGSRKLTVTTPSNVVSSLLASLTPTSPWLELHAQANTMKVYGDTEDSPIAGVQVLEFTQTYWGI